MRDHKLVGAGEHKVVQVAQIQHLLPVECVQHCHVCVCVCVCARACVCVGAQGSGRGAG